MCSCCGSSSSRSDTSSEDSTNQHDEEEALTLEYYQLVLAYQMEYSTRLYTSGKGFYPSLLYYPLADQLSCIDLYEWYNDDLKVTYLENCIKDLLISMRSALELVPTQFKFEWFLKFDTASMVLKRGKDLRKAMKDTWNYRYNHSRNIGVEDNCREIVYFLRVGYREKTGQELAEDAKAKAAKEKPTTKSIAEQDTVRSDGQVVTINTTTNREEEDIESLCTFAVAYQETCKAECSEKALVDKPRFLHALAEEIVDTVEKLPYEEATAAPALQQLVKKFIFCCQTYSKVVPGQHSLEFFIKHGSQLTNATSIPELTLRKGQGLGNCLQQAIDYSGNAAPEECRLRKQCRLIVRFLRTAYICERLLVGAS